MPGVSVRVRNHRLSPAEAELWIEAGQAFSGPGLELRGRFVGPRCAYASTVEVAYPLRPLPPGQGGPGMAAARVVIPEPSLWDPTCPFLYHGSVELWRDGQRLMGVQVTDGLRSATLSLEGLRWNGHLLSLRGEARQELTEAEAADLRRAGVNLIRCRAAPDDLAAAARLCAACDRLGFLALVHVPAAVSLATLTKSLAQHASLLGCTIGPEQAQAATAALAPDTFLGLEMSELGRGTVPGGMAFVCCRPEALANLADLPLPRIVLGEPAGEHPGVIGWVRSPDK